MDSRSWLWRRKSSDKSSGETDSSGSGLGLDLGLGSISSPSERFSDEQQVYSVSKTQSLEISSKNEEDTYDSVKILTQKLSAAVASVNEKEELVKQHAKVAEEAVTGWEKAENEMNMLYQQLDTALKKNSTLEDKVIHLDRALKECLRQLRQVREEQDQKILEATTKKSDSSESSNSGQLADAIAKADAAEKENTSLQLKLRSLSEELESRTVERDLSTKRAETASKQHLESMRKVTKLEAECRGLKAIARKQASFNNDRSKKLDRFKADESEMTPTLNSGFMDDFLEMEKIISKPVQESGNDNTASKANLEVMINRTAELQERIESVESEKAELGDKLQHSESHFRQLKSQFDECQNQLRMSQDELNDANKKISVLQAELDLAVELRKAIDLELDDANVRREDAESRCKTLENESKILQSKVGVLEDKISKMEKDAATWQNQVVSMKESKEEVEQKLKYVIGRKESAESKLERVQTEVKSLLAKILSLENEGEKEKRLSAELGAKCKKLESERSRTKELDGKCRKLESELLRTKNEAESLVAKVSSLEDELGKERMLSADFKDKCRKLGDELSKVKSEGFTPVSKEELHKQQEKEIAVAAKNLAECQKTIASLGNQLKSLASLEDLFSDSEDQTNNSNKDSQPDSVSSETGNRNNSSNSLKENQEFTKKAKQKEVSSTIVVEKSRKNGFEKIFSRSRSTVRTRN